MRKTRIINSLLPYIRECSVATVFVHLISGVMV